MIPFLDDFHKGSASHVRLDSLKVGDKAIILSLHFVGALVVRIDKLEREVKDDTFTSWVQGHIVAPERHAYTMAGADKIPVHFSRSGDTLALPVSLAQWNTYLLTPQPVETEASAEG
jgi:hypothetical protein